MNDEDVTLAIREPDVTNNVSQVVSVAQVSELNWLRRQRDIAATNMIL